MIYKYSDDGEVYSGDWKNGKEEGFGKKVYADGIIFCGCFRNGIEQDETWQFKNGNMYVGTKLGTNTYRDGLMVYHVGDDEYKQTETFNVNGKLTDWSKRYENWVLVFRGYYSDGQEIGRDMSIMIMVS